jgi:hypothetical protein
MDFKIYNYYQFDKLKFFNFLQTEVKNSKDRAKNNMWHDQWQDHKNTLPFLLEYTNRFKEPNGQFHILTLNDNIIGCGGVYISYFHKEIALCGTRLWMSRKYRNKLIVRETIFPEHKKWSVQNKCKILALCFNDYNKSLIKTFNRIRLGENKTRIKTPYHLFYNGAIEIGFPVKIQNTKQWVIYELLDLNFEFDWSSIRYS